MSDIKHISSSFEEVGGTHILKIMYILKEFSDLGTKASIEGGM